MSIDDNVPVSSLAVSSLVSLAAILLVSGVAKMLSPRSSRSLLGSADLPAALRAPWLQAALPWAEVVLAAGLVLASGPWLVAVAVAVVLVFAAFTVVVVRGTRAPDPASCGCFGALSTAPVSWRTVVRNLVFTLVAVLALALCLSGFQGPVVALPWRGVLAGAIPVLCVLVILWSEHPADGTRSPRDLSRVPPLPPAPPQDGDAAASAPAQGAPGPDGAQEPGDYERLPIPYASLQDADGARVTLRGLAGSRARVLVGVSTTCGWCAPAIERISGTGQDLGPVAVHAVVTRESERDVLPEALRARTLVDDRQEMAAVFERPGNPWAVVLGADGLLAGGPVAGSGPVLELLDELAERFED
ncbi:MauE/DoxX family redox-associated membrane protein [Kocuria sp.]|uniref:MauE/DoxX family redox-associated membrane protein n=1 Tax=Kocuria sp. TaxID=1871328 RepID=UPI0026DB73FD|nr:MauE/DoxX family redox-associated membrane protein [Kocuria sp.]MDO4919679.1 MauE/DoxX family redox-associated membrane protein [Kocuria sp.]